MFKNRDILIRNLATIFIVCYMIFAIFPFPPLVWRIALVLLCIYTIAFKQRKRQPCEKAVLVFTIFNLIHFFISYFWQTPSVTQIGNILCALLPFSLFAYLAEKGVMTEKYFTIGGIVFLLASVIHYYQARAFIVETFSLDKDAMMTNSFTGVFLYLLPMLFFIKNNAQRWLMLLICLFFLLSGAKRGNIIAAVIPIVLFVFYELKDAKRAPFKILLLLCVTVAASALVYNWFTTNDYLLYRLEQTMEGNSSERDEIFANAWSAWSNCNNVIHYIGGFGFDGTIHHPLLFGLRAHNDWLEILVDYGLLGIILYLTIFVDLAKKIKRTKNVKIKMIMISSVAIWFFKTLYSMGFSEGSMSLLMIGLGTAIGESQRIDRGLFENR